MTDRPAPPRPPAGPAKSDRSARRAAALRANLARRKARTRARAGGGPAEAGTPSPDR